MCFVVSILGLLELAATKPHTLDEEQTAAVKHGLEAISADSTRVVTPKAAFRVSESLKEQEKETKIKRYPNIL